MDCRDIKIILEQYIDNEVDREMKSVVKLHLSTCDDCSKEYDELMGYKKEMGSLKAVSAPDNFLAEINRKIESPSPLKQLIDKFYYPLQNSPSRQRD